MQSNALLKHLSLDPWLLLRLLFMLELTLSCTTIETNSDFTLSSYHSSQEMNLCVCIGIGVIPIQARDIRELLYEWVSIKFYWIFENRPQVHTGAQYSNAFKPKLTTYWAISVLSIGGNQASLTSNSYYFHRSNFPLNEFLSKCTRMNIFDFCCSRRFFLFRKSECMTLWHSA